MSDFSTSSITPMLSPDMLSGGVSGMNGASQPARLKAACKAMEGIFASQIMSELGKGMGGTDGSQQSGLYQDFILEKSLTPPPPHLHGLTPTTTPHAHGTSS
jgi:hypothetical protein